MDLKTINQLEKIIQKLLDKAMVNVATKDDLKNFATKNDLIKMEKRLTKEIRYAEAFAIITADNRKAEKTVVVELDKRITQIERKFAT